MMLAIRFRHFLPRSPRSLCRQLFGCLLLAVPLLAMAADSDGDGYDDAVDAFPNDPAAAVDTDGDGKPDDYLYSFLDGFESGSSLSLPWSRVTSSQSQGWGIKSTYGASQGGFAAASDMKVTGTTYPSRLNNKLQLGLTVSGSVRLRYDYKYSNPATSWVVVYFKIPCDNCRYGEATFTSTWITETKTLSAGSHTLVWEHDCQSTESTRGGSGCVYANGDAAVIDNVRVYPVTALLDDQDDDNDGISDTSDKFPLNAAASLDGDNDGQADSWHQPNPYSCAAAATTCNGLTLDLTVPQTITVTQAAPASAVYGSSFTVAATASSGLPVSIAASGGCAGSGTGSAVVTMTSSTTACTVTYSQAGNSNYNAVTLSGTTTATKASQIITVTQPAPVSALYGSSFTVAATASSGLAVTVSSSGGCSRSGNTLTITSTTVSCKVTYAQSGDSNYSAATSLSSNTAVLSDDYDLDGVLNENDNCPNSANAGQLDTDGDGQGDACDSDDDNDGVADTADTFPLNAAESVDTDGDGTGNNADTDDDNDGLSDAQEATLTTNPLLADTDGDGLSDEAEVNTHATNPKSTDSDSDGMADAWEITNGLNPLNGNDDLLDNDGDGWTNEQEKDRDTNPNSAASKPSAGTDKFYVTNGSSVLYELNKQTGVVTAVAATALGSDVEAMASNTSGTLYALDEVGSRLYSINASTGVKAVIGGAITPSVANAAEIAIDENNILWWVNGSSALYTINTATAVSTLVGSGSVTMKMIAAHQGVLYGSTGSALYSINKTTGAQTLIGNHGVSCSLEDSMSSDGADIWMLCETPATLYKVNKTTGVATVVVNTAASWESLAITRLLDTDADGMPDNWEDANGLDKNSADHLVDKDGEGLINLQEYLNATNPSVADTDGDGVSDYQEVMVMRTDPADSDDDGISDSVDTDDDNDGVADGTDKFPLNAAASKDADNDGQPDSWQQPNPYGCAADAATCNGLTLDLTLPQAITVTQASPASAVYGASFTVAATASSGLPVSIAASGGCTGVGTGSALVTMSSATTACSVMYSQVGNSNFNAATSVSSTTTASKANQSITVTQPAPASAEYGSSFTVAATASSGLAVTVSHSGGCTRSGNTLTMNSTTTACSVIYSQAGNSEYNPATTVSSTTTATKASQSITVTQPAPASALYGSSFTVAATASSGLAVTISASEGCTGSGSGSAVVTMAVSGALLCKVTYSQAGSTNYLVAPAVVTMTAAGSSGVTVISFETGIPSGWSKPAAASASWVIDSAVAHHQSKSLRTGTVAHNGKAQIEFTANMANSVLVFWLKVSTEPNNDIFRVYVDGAGKLVKSGELDWEQVTIPVTAGVHTVRFEYWKNGSVSSGSDRVWIDELRVPVDTDNDGVLDGADLDDDNDGVPDYIDAAPLNAANANERSLQRNAPYSGSAVAEGAGL